MTVFVPSLNETDLKKINLALQQLGAGRSNATGTVTLAVNASSTVVIPQHAGIIAVGSQPILTPITAAAAAELASGNLFVSSVAKDIFTINHSTAATAGRTFLYAIIG